MKNKLKRMIKSCLTRNQRKYIKGFCKHIKFKIQSKDTIIKSNNYKIEIFEKKKKNVFNGYYDINPLNNNKMLVHCCKNNAKTNKDNIEIGWFDISNKKYHKVTSSHAWCWQQGTRLRWSKNKDIIIYNDCLNNHYCCLFYNIILNKIVKKIDYPLYDITPNEKFGLSLNFSRLQRLRPGYGYDALEDKSINQKAPEDDGIFLVDISDNSSKLIITLHDLAKLNDKEELYQHYINHISISPSGKKFIFFHIYAKENGWSTQLISANIDGSQISVLENGDLVSHYTWKSDNELLITGIDKNNSPFYRLYETTGKYKIDITDKYLGQDGHPTFTSNNIFITDTYPIENYQTLFIYDISKKNAYDIIKLYSDPRLFEEHRCDLHPKVDDKKNLIFVDSTFRKGKRSVIMIGGEKNAKKRKKID